jgi:hypothetical protein
VCDAGTWSAEVVLVLVLELVLIFNCSREEALSCSRLLCCSEGGVLASGEPELAAGPDEVNEEKSELADENTDAAEAEAVVGAPLPASAEKRLPPLVEVEACEGSALGAAPAVVVREGSEAGLAMSSCARARSRSWRWRMRNSF